MPIEPRTRRSPQRSGPMASSCRRIPTTRSSFSPSRSRRFRKATPRGSWCTTTRHLLGPACTWTPTGSGPSFDVPAASAGRAHALLLSARRLPERFPTPVPGRPTRDPAVRPRKRPSLKVRILLDRRATEGAHPPVDPQRFASRVARWVAGACPLSRATSVRRNGRVDLETDPHGVLSHRRARRRMARHPRSCTRPTGSSVRRRRPRGRGLATSTSLGLSRTSPSSASRFRRFAGRPSTPTRASRWAVSSATSWSISRTENPLRSSGSTVIVRAGSTSASTREVSGTSSLLRGSSTGSSPGSGWTLVHDGIFEEYAFHRKRDSSLRRSRPPRSDARDPDLVRRDGPRRRSHRRSHCSMRSGPEPAHRRVRRGHRHLDRPPGGGGLGRSAGIRDSVRCPFHRSGMSPSSSFSNPPISLTVEIRSAEPLPPTVGLQVKASQKIFRAPATGALPRIHWELLEPEFQASSSSARDWDLSLSLPADGSFLFHELVPGREFRLILRDRLAGTLVRTSRLRGSGPSKNARSFSRSTDRQASLEGRVLDPDGRPAGGARVMLKVGTRSISTTTDPAGRYHFERLLVARGAEALLHAEHDGFARSGPRTITIGGTSQRGHPPPGLIPPSRSASRTVSTIPRTPTG